MSLGYILLSNISHVGKFYFFERFKNIFSFKLYLERKMYDKFTIEQNEIRIASEFSASAYLFLRLNFEHLTINVEKLRQFI